jgi:hypothetical protein
VARRTEDVSAGRRQPVEDRLQLAAGSRQRTEDGSQKTEHTCRIFLWERLSPPASPEGEADGGQAAANKQLQRL